MASRRASSGTLLSFLHFYHSLHKLTNLQSPPTNHIRSGGQITIYHNDSQPNSVVTKHLLSITTTNYQPSTSPSRFRICSPSTLFRSNNNWSQMQVPLRIVGGRVKLLRLGDWEERKCGNKTSTPTTTMTERSKQETFDHQTSDFFLLCLAARLNSSIGDT